MLAVLRVSDCFHESNTLANAHMKLRLSTKLVSRRPTSIPSVAILQEERPTCKRQDQALMNLVADAGQIAS